MENNKAKLYTKILNVISKVEKITKSGYNSHQKYHYSTEEDLIGSIRQLMLDNKLLILTSSVVKDVVKLSKPQKEGPAKESLVTVVETTHKFIDADTGESESVTSSGSGWDELDKGSFKAVTGAMKYFISKNFLISSEDDPENDGVTPKNTAAPKSFSRSKPAEVKAEAALTAPVVIDTKPLPGTMDSGGVASGVIATQSPATVIPTKAAQTITKPKFSGRGNTTKTEPNFP